MSKKQEMPNTGYAIIRCDDGVIVARLTSFPVCERALMYRRGDTVSFMPLQPDEIVVMPAGASPFKQMSATPGALRAEMCGCFAEAVHGPRAAARALHVSTWEIEQAAAGRRNYTVLTLEMLARQYPGAELYLAIGSDMLLSFDGWHRWQEILRLAHLVVTSRNTGDIPALQAKAEQLDPGGSRVLFAPVTALPMASSDIRARLAGGESCENELPALVQRVIAREGLYRAKGD